MSPPTQTTQPGSNADRLQLHLPEGWPLRWSDQPARFRWRVTTGEQTSLGEGTLGDIPAARERIVVLSAQQVLCVPVSLPSGRAGRTPQVLRNAIEDALATPSDDTHVIVLGILANQQTLLAVIDRALLQAAVDELIDCDLRPTRIGSEAECFSATAPRTWQVVLGASGGFVHTAGLETVALDQGPAQGVEAPLGLRLLITERAALGEGPDSVVVYSDQPGEIDLAAWSAQLDRPVTHAGRWAPEHAALALRGIDLGLPGTRRPRGRSPWTAYRPAAWLFALALCIQLGYTAIENWQMQREQRQLRQSMEDRFRRVFPDARTIADPVLQMSRLYEAQVHGKAGTGPADFLNLFSSAAAALAILHARTDAARYERGQLSLDLVLPSGPAIDQLQSQLPGGARVLVEHIAPPDLKGAVAATVRIVAGGS